MANNKPITTLKSRAEFQNVFKNGKRIYPSSWLVVNVCPNKLDAQRFGWTLPRYVGSAVTRNKFKRWCREFLRTKLSEVDVSGFDINFVFKRNQKEFYKSLSHEEFDKAFERFFKKVS